MREKIREIRFLNFRGLPNYSCVLRGRSLVVLGGNGKGKSAIVDGIEFIFDGCIRRFSGVGTGNISENEAIPHVSKQGDPSVELVFTPTNTSVSRGFGDTVSLTSTLPTVQEYLDGHPPVGSFVLRRYQILEFISDQDAKRYQKYIRLLGLDSLDAIQRSFIDAEQNADKRVSECQLTLQQIFNYFRDPETELMPSNHDELLSKYAETVSQFGLGTISNWDQLDDAITKLDAKRSPESKRKIDALNLAISHLENEILREIDGEVTLINKLQISIRDLQAASEETPKSEIIKEGIKYFKEHPDIAKCPLCEQTFLSGYEVVFDRLAERDLNLTRFRELERDWNESLDRLVTTIQRAIYQLTQEQSDYTVYPEEVNTQTLTAHRENLQRWIDLIRSKKEDRTLEDVIISTSVQGIRDIRLKLPGILKKERSTFIQHDAIAVEKAVNMLQKAKEKLNEIKGAELALKDALKLHKTMQIVCDSFSQSREHAVKSIFSKIANKVIKYYQRLHEDSDATGIIECTNLTLTPTSRAATGGLRLAIEYLGAVDSCDPRTFLSEGHLDSLGLCLYLATAKIFNTPGSLLVLDDILTSIDKEHRHRVTELLLEEFSNFQLVLTTHDEYWFESIKNSVLARGEQNNWIFKSISRWTVEYGPESSAYEGTWGWIDSNLTEDSYRNLGGPLRLVLEDYLKRVAEKIELKVRYHGNGKYTAGDFKFAGIVNEIREKLIKNKPGEEEQIKREIQHVFGNDNLINILSHDNPGRLEVTLPETRDFVCGLKALTKWSDECQIIKGHGR